MRIIGGKYKGKKLIQPLDKTTRPLKDLVKESIFNIIQHSNKINIQIENSKILDLYAGSGSFGIECISRDAKLVYFFEKHLNAIKILNQNINSLKENSNYKLFEKDCLDFIASESFTTKNFNVIFLDPPFRKGLLEQAITLLDDHPIVQEGALIYLEREKEMAGLCLPENWRLLKDKTAGQLVYQLFRVSNSFGP